MLPEAIRDSLATNSGSYEQRYLDVMSFKPSPEFAHS
jgi:hypothetical protein